MLRLKQRLLHVKRVILQSDNAKCYTSADLLLMLPIISIVHDVQVTRFIHTETQDGKWLLDAHFATCTKWVREYLKEGHNAVTGMQLAAALQ